MRWLFTCLWLFVCAEICDAEELGPRFPVENPFRGWTDTSVSQGIKVRNWHFPPSRAKGGKIVGDTFENVTFEGVVFRNVILQNNVFLNCRFENVVFVGGEWVGNRYEGGELRGIHMGNVENPFSADTTGPMNTHVEHDTFVGVTIRDWTFKGYPGAYRMGNLYFRNCSLRDNDFGNSLDTYGSTVMDSCEVKGEGWYPENLILRHCRMTGSQAISGRTGVDLHSTYGFALDSAIDMTVHGSFFNRHMLNIRTQARKYARNVDVSRASDVVLKQFEHVSLRNCGFAWLDSGRNAQVEDVASVGLSGIVENVSIRNASKGIGLYGDTTRHVQIRNVQTEALLSSTNYFSYRSPRHLVEDCVFEDFTVQKLELTGATYVRCVFRNIRITDKVLALPDPPVFKDCVFENVHRDKGVKVWASPTKGQSFGTDGPQEVRLPWESDEEWQRVQGEKEPSKPWWKLW